ncbi:PilZ domain-containing protein [Aurantiacibacter hainanensis]|uniref:PilZ domain-containing protein n=1 Tax=Aurantiacibacter hainanensis TaxID=3076114 RepID=UPI0030C75DD0
MAASRQPLIAQILKDERGSVRCTIRLSADVASTSAQSRTLIHDLSETGLKLTSNTEFEIGELLTVELPLVGSAEARIVWNNENSYGAEFVKPVSKGTVSAALLSSRPFLPIRSDESAIEELVIGLNPSLDELADWAYEFEQTKGARGYRLLGFRQSDDGIISAWCSPASS